MKKPFRAIILAAGQGTRLRPYTDNIPKCMVEVAGRPMLHWQLDVLEQAGVEEIVAVTGYQEEVIDDPRVTKVYNPEYDSTNMIYSLMCAEKYMEGNLLIAYGDIVYSGRVLEELMNDPNEIVIASDEAWEEYWSERFEDPLSDAETFRKGEDGCVRSLGKTPRSSEEVEGQYTGLTKLGPNGCERIREVYRQCNSRPECKQNAWDSGRPLRNAYMTDLLNYLAGQGELFYRPIHRGWVEVDDPDDLKLANRVVPNLTKKKPAN